VLQKVISQDFAVASDYSPVLLTLTAHVLNKEKQRSVGNIGRAASETCSATWNFGAYWTFALGPRKTTENLDRVGRSQEMNEYMHKFAYKHTCICNAILWLSVNLRVYFSSEKSNVIRVCCSFNKREYVSQFISSDLDKWLAWPLSDWTSTPLAIPAASKVKVKFILRPSVGQSVLVRHPSRTCDQFFLVSLIILDSYGFVHVGRPIWCKIGSVASAVVAGNRQRSLPRVWVPRDSWAYLIVPIFEALQSGGPKLKSK
jgi:hypothetical protein